jgi:endo-1,4-beta-xylanase
MRSLIGHVFFFGTIAAILLAAGCGTEQGTGLLNLSISADNTVPSEAASRIVIGYQGGSDHVWPGTFPPQARSSLPLKLQVPNLPARNNPITFTVQAFDGSNCAVTKAATAMAIIKAGTETDPIAVTLTATGIACGDGDAAVGSTDGGNPLDGSASGLDGTGALGLDAGIAPPDGATVDSSAVDSAKETPQASTAEAGNVQDRADAISPAGAEVADSSLLSEAGTDVPLGSGGTLGTGGIPGSGGGGTGGAAGTVGTSSGGTTGTGGGTGSGGATGTGGGTGSGGATNTRGTTSTGGVQGTGGTTDTGGTAGTGGVQGTGGLTGTGGAGTGGTSSVNCSAAMPSGGTLHTGDSQGGTGNLAWNLWMNGNGGTLTTFSNTPAFRASWNNSGDYLVGFGLVWNSTQTYDQIGTISADYAETQTGTGGGYSYIGIYGWSVQPTIEYYIVEDSFGAIPVNPGTTVNMGTVILDGATYNIYTRPVSGTGGAIDGSSSWMQFWSVRQTARQCGHISISQHFAAWNAAGMILGRMEEARILVEVGGGHWNH